MPLSEEELRLLEQMERALVEEDPKFASTLRGTLAASFRTPRAIARRRRLRRSASWSLMSGAIKALLRRRHRRLRGDARPRPPSRSPRSAASSAPRPRRPQRQRGQPPRGGFTVIDGGRTGQTRRPRHQRRRLASWSAWKSAGAAAARQRLLSSWTAARESERRPRGAGRRGREPPLARLPEPRQLRSRASASASRIAVAASSGAVGRARSARAARGGHQSPTWSTTPACHGGARRTPSSRPAASAGGEQRPAGHQSAGGGRAGGAAVQRRDQVCISARQVPASLGAGAGVAQPLERGARSGRARTRPLGLVSGPRRGRSGVNSSARRAEEWTSARGSATAIGPRATAAAGRARCRAAPPRLLGAESAGCVAAATAQDRRGSSASPTSSTSGERADAIHAQGMPPPPDWSPPGPGGFCSLGVGPRAGGSSARRSRALPGRSVSAWPGTRAPCSPATVSARPGGVGSNRTQPAPEKNSSGQACRSWRL